jgi:hypothetical protein
MGTRYTVTWTMTYWSEEEGDAAIVDVAKQVVGDLRDPDCAVTMFNVEKVSDKSAYWIDVEKIWDMRGSMDNVTAADIRLETDESWD